MLTSLGFRVISFPYEKQEEDLWEPASWRVWGDTSKLPAPQLEKGVRWAVWAPHGLCYSEITADRVSEAMNSVCLSFLLHTMGLLVWYVP